jgi:type VI secretion system protein ImpE
MFTSGEADYPLMDARLIEFDLNDSTGDHG